MRRSALPRHRAIGGAKTPIAQKQPIAGVEHRLAAAFAKTTLAEAAPVTDFPSARAVRINRLGSWSSSTGFFANGAIRHPVTMRFAGRCVLSRRLAITGSLDALQKLIASCARNSGGIGGPGGELKVPRELPRPPLNVRQCRFGPRCASPLFPGSASARLSPLSW
jgi:hypothetical protein